MVTASPDPAARGSAGAPPILENAANYYLEARGRSKRERRRRWTRMIGLPPLIGYFALAVVSPSNTMILPGKIVAVFTLLLISVGFITGVFPYLTYWRVMRARDDWWLTGTRGETLVGGIYSKFRVNGWRRLLRISGLFGMIATGRMLSGPWSPMDIIFSQVLSLASGVMLGLSLFLPLAAPSLFWAAIRYDCHGERFMLWIKGAPPPEGGYRLGDALVAGIWFVIYGAVCGSVWFLPLIGMERLQIEMIEITPALRPKWTPEIILAALACFPAGLAIGCVWGGVARILAPILRRDLAKRLDELLELGRIEKHEWNGPRAVGGEK